MDRIAPELALGYGSAADDLIVSCRREGFQRLRVVADSNTWEALGRATVESLVGAGMGAEATVLAAGVRADEAALGTLLAEESMRPAPLAAVGSGTITDLVRLYASRMRLPFFSLPTAASVDAYASSVSAMTIGGLKRTVAAIAPRGIFVDLDTIRAAPAPMTSAGFGDMLCKFSALADWRLGALIWGEPWDEAIADRSRAAATECVAVAALVGRREPAGIETLIRALVESGMAMSLAGHSRPASGAEHHLSHYWETALEREGRPPLLHGLKVGVATALVAALWERMRTVDRSELRERLAVAVPPDVKSEEDAIRRDFGASAPEILAAQRRFLSLDARGFEALKGAVDRNWDEIVGLAGSVPGQRETKSLLAAAGCPTEASELGLEAALVEAAWAGGHRLRDRFTVMKLARLLGIADPPPAGR